MAWYFKAFALTGRQVCVRNYPGRCPGLGASALSGRVGTWWCSDTWGVWGHDGVLIPEACGDMMVFRCLGRVGTWWCSDAWGVWGHDGVLMPGRVGAWWCSDAWGVWGHDGVLMYGPCGAYLRNLNAYFCTQAYAADYSSGSISLLKWLNQLTQVAQSAYSSGSIRLLKWLNQRVQPSA